MLSLRVISGMEASLSHRSTELETEELNEGKIIQVKALDAFSEERQRLEQLQTELLEQCDVAENFSCGILLEPLKDPVITPKGHLFSKKALLDTFQQQIAQQQAQIEREKNKNIPEHEKRNKIETTCPGASTSLSESELSSPSQLIQLVTQYTHAHEAITNRIKKMNLKERQMVLCEVQEYKILEAKLIKDIEEFKLQFSKDYMSGREQQRQFEALHLEQNKSKVKIKTLKERLKIDINNRDHLQFWENNTTLCFHGRGGIEIIHPEGQVFRVPTRIYHMMQAAAQNDLDYDTLKTELDLIRTYGPRCLSNPFSFFTRKAATMAAYTEDLEYLDFRSPRL